MRNWDDDPSPTFSFSQWPRGLQRAFWLLFPISAPLWVAAMFIVCMGLGFGLFLLGVAKPLRHLRLPRRARGDSAHASYQTIAQTR